ncbi:MAG: amidohydrolase family protein [Pseudomonadota bacterium]|nr:amidohydrolase family protein [Pseudomonadota bacterium]
MSLSSIRLISLGLVLITFIFGCTSLKKNINLSITSGTQFSVTGDKSNFYFDMQGIIWKLPKDSSRAIQLTGLKNDLRRPQISPDGKWLTAQSFSTGSWNIVLVSLENGKLKRLTQNLHDDVEPVWSKDGSLIFFSSDQSGNQDIWSVDIHSTAQTQLTEGPADEYAPAILGSELLFISNKSGKPSFYRKALQIDAHEFEFMPNLNNEGLFAPRLNQNGEKLAWVQTIERNGFPSVRINEIVMMDLISGEKEILSKSSNDVFGMAPFWLDTDTLFFVMDGIIKRFDTKNKKISSVKFVANLPLQSIHFKPRVPLAFSNKTQPVLGIVDPILLPDESIIFTAIGDLWQLSNNNELKQLTNDSWVERDVNISPDGKNLAYISDRSGSMQIWLRDLKNGEIKKITNNSGGPRYPTFSPNNKKLAYQERGPIGVRDFTIRILDLESKKSYRLRSAPKIWPGRMSWSMDGNYLTVAALVNQSSRSNDGRNQLIRIDVNTDKKQVVKLPNAITPDFGPVASPDGKNIALIVDGSLWRMALTKDGRSAGQPEQILDALVESPAWSKDAKKILVLTSQGLELVDSSNGKRKLRPINLKWKPLTDGKQKIIHAGKLWDGISNEYRENIDILIQDNRIISVHQHRDHANKVVIDASNKTVLPGLIDHHIHFEPHNGEWIGRALLAFGITTAVEPGGLPYESREIMESWLSGRRIGPRLVFAGPQLDGARRTFNFASHINSKNRLMRELERGDFLGYGLLKTYRRLRPELQEEVVRQGHLRGLPVTSHAAFRNLGFGGNRSEHMRGSSRLNYSDKQSDLLNSYEDIQNIYLVTKSSLTPTIINQGGFFDFASKNNMEAIKSYISIYPQSYRKNLKNFTQFTNRNIDLIRKGLRNAGTSLNMMKKNGLNIVAGTDSPIFPYGLALIIELQNYVDSGLSPLEALRTATTNAAKTMGAEQHVGKIAPGMLADLIIIDGNPIQKITDIFNIEGVILNGNYQKIEDLTSLSQANPSAKNQDF